MIYRLRKKFVMITAVSVGIVFALIFGGIYFISRSQLNHSLDMLADVIAMNDGVFRTSIERKILLRPAAFRKINF